LVSELSFPGRELDMKQWQRYAWPVVWTLLMVAQIALSFFLYNRTGLKIVENTGWVVLAVSAIFGWLPIFTLRKRGGVPKGKSYVHTTVLVESGVYAVVRHPQFLAGILLNLALILIAQNWIIAVIGVSAAVLGYLDALKADEGLIVKFGDVYKDYMRRVPRMNFLAGLVRLAKAK
jgi:protein-S-isoprenylcysteine O-methyltransferase Ste14